MSLVHLRLALMLAAVALSAIAVAPLPQVVAQADRAPAAIAPAEVADPGPPRSVETSGVPGVRQLFKGRDEAGRLFLLPDFTFKEWEEFLKFKRNLRPPAPPEYSFVGAIELTGVVDGSHATIAIACRVRLNQTSDPNLAENRWTRIPFRLDNSIRLPGFEHRGPGDVSWSDEEGGEGHVVWVRGAPGSEHDLEWKVMLPVRHGQQRAISILAPTTALHLNLTVPEQDLRWTLSDPERNLLTATERLGETTRAIVLSPGGPLRLSWRSRNAAPPLLTAETESFVRLVGMQVDTSATVTVRSTREPVEEFFLRLPPGSQLIPSDQPELSVQVVEAARADELGGGTIVRVAPVTSLARNEYVVDLQTLRPLGVDRAAVASIETAGFEVLGAVTQSGEIHLHVEGEWTVDWESGPYVRQVPVSEDQPVGARFLFSRQPYSLVAHIRPLRSRISVDPKYIVDVNPQRVTLDARLNYRIQGARTNQLRVDLPGWTVDSVSPQEYVASTARDGDELTIQLSSASAILAGDIALRLAMHQDYDASRPLSIQLPKPRAESSVPASVAVVSAPNVRLSPRNEGLTGLVTDSAVAELVADRQQRPLSYRQDVASKVSVFTANVEVLPQSVSVDVHSEILLTTQRIEVEQQLVYRIDYEPLQELMFEVPQRLAETRDWEVVEGGVELKVSRVLNESDGQLQTTAIPADVVANRRIIADLREERIGTLRLVFRYQLPIDQELISGDVGLLDIGLVQPAEEDARIEENTLRLHSSSDFETQLADENWELVAEPSPSFAASGQPFYRVPGPVSLVTAEVELAQQKKQSTTTLNKVWLQTWQTEGVRRDRVCYQLLAHDSYVEFALPSQIEALEVAVNGQRQITEWRSGELLRVELPGNALRESTVEIWYWLKEGGGLWGSIQTSIPRLVGVERAGRLFWQVVVPENKHLLWPSKGLTSESTWRRDGYLWRRMPNRKQDRLEQLVGASMQAALPPGTNRYLFSSTGPLRTVGFLTVDRAVLVLCVSAVVLVFGLLLISFARLRHPAILFTLGLLLLSATATFPELATLAAQAAVLGFVLVLVSRLLQWTVAIRPTRRPLPPSQSQSATRSRVHGPPAEMGSSNIATTVTPLNYPLPAAEPER